ncbi:hypothetical protein B0O99DRAFT_606242 [Bisporella sp. PMI_857]|nr:hypothetical protein B0O99DRAFT_606242 [Bisporella sp. PMI_857]
MELNHRPGSPDWSVRQMGVYQQYNSATKASSCVLLNPSCEVQRRIKELSGWKPV